MIRLRALPPLLIEATTDGYGARCFPGIHDLLRREVYRAAALMVLTLFSGQQRIELVGKGLAIGLAE